MVKFSLIIFIGFIITSCGYLILPKSYFDTYTVNIKKTKENSLNLQKAYVIEDTFQSKYFSRSFNTEAKRYRYIFLYNNNLMATISTPMFNYPNKWIFSVEELQDSIKAGFFDKPCNQNRIAWTYYKIEKNKLIKYSFESNISGGIEVLSRVSLIEPTFILYKDGFVYEEEYNQYKNTPSLETFLFKPIEISVKPDSSKSNFIKMYNKYLLTGKRRFYSYNKDSEKYFNKK